MYNSNWSYQCIADELFMFQIDWIIYCYYNTILVLLRSLQPYFWCECEKGRKWKMAYNIGFYVSVNQINTFLTLQWLPLIFWEKFKNKSSQLGVLVNYLCCSCNICCKTNTSTCRRVIVWGAFEGTLKFFPEVNQKPFLWEQLLNVGLYHCLSWSFNLGLPDIIRRKPA